MASKYCQKRYVPFVCAACKRLHRCGWLRGGSR